MTINNRDNNYNNYVNNCDNSNDNKDERSRDTIYYGGDDNSSHGMVVVLTILITIMIQTTHIYQMMKTKMMVLEMITMIIIMMKRKMIKYISCNKIEQVGLSYLYIIVCHINNKIANMKKKKSFIPILNKILKQLFHPAFSYPKTAIEGS